MFVGEAPGFHEDKQGVPFVGAAGKLLGKLLDGIGLTREDVYVANVMKCRPPGNRDPQPEEIESCEPHLWKQIELIQPTLIATLGNFATKLLSGKPNGITQVHGREQQVVLGGNPVTLYPIFHPAAALYTPRMLQVLEEDFARIPALLGRVVGPPPVVLAAAPVAGARAADPARPLLARAVDTLVSDTIPRCRHVTGSPEATEALAARRWPRRLAAGDVVAVSGELGAGKTTFVRGAARALGVTGPVSSPTFTIGHRYDAPGARRPPRPVPRRRARSEEWGDLEPYFDGTIAFVEWPEHGGDWLPEARVVVTLEHVDESHRSVRIDSDLGL